MLTIFVSTNQYITRLLMPSSPTQIRREGPGPYTSIFLLFTIPSLVALLFAIPDVLFAILTRVIIPALTHFIRITSNKRVEFLLGLLTTFSAAIPLFLVNRANPVLSNQQTNRAPNFFDPQPNASAKAVTGSPLGKRPEKISLGSDISTPK